MWPWWMAVGMAMGGRSQSYDVCVAEWHTIVPMDLSEKVRYGLEGSHYCQFLLNARPLQFGGMLVIQDA